MLTPKQITLLMAAVDLLEEADALVQKALGATDACEDTHNAIQEVVEDLLCDIQENSPEDMDA
jgi:hypothetical protein